MVDNSNHSLQNIRHPELITGDMYIRNYKQFLPRYIAGGSPSADTFRTYTECIDQFLSWCIQNQLHPLSVQDYQMRLYLEHITQQGYKKSSTALYIIAIRAFYHVAIKLGLIAENPCEDIQTRNSFHYDEQYHFFTTEQIGMLLQSLQQEDNQFLRYRNMLIVMLMGIEGLRNVEVHRLNDEDIDWQHSVIFIRGKGHDGYIYPSGKTMQLIKDYQGSRPASVKEGLLTPLLISNSHNSQCKRLSRNGIRYLMNNALTTVGLKEKGVACHVLRHSCGTNLYAKTKDLRLVQETLRQRDPKIAARYAHVQERMEHRYTDALVPDIASK